jgi:hypothetical protein
MDEAHYGPWNPGLASQVPLEWRHLCTVFRPENSYTGVSAANELQQLTGLPLCELVAFRPQRLLLHELLIRVMTDFSVPDGSRIGDLGINFREMIQRLLDRHVAPELPTIVASYDEGRHQLAQQVSAAFARLTASKTSKRPAPRWGLGEISECERVANSSVEPEARAAHRALARVMSSLFVTHGCAWGTSELVCKVATDLACNIHGGDVIGQRIAPILEKAAMVEGYQLLPRQAHPIIINTKGPSASGKSTLRPLQRQLAGAIGARWRDFALISPDIWRKQLLDYASLGAAFRYAGAFTAEELQIVDQKLDRYMVRKHERGEMAHLLIDRFRFDSFAPDSAEAGSNLLTRFGESVYLFFVITPPEQLVERYGRVDINATTLEGLCRNGCAGSVHGASTSDGAPAVPQRGGGRSKRANVGRLGQGYLRCAHPTIRPGNLQSGPRESPDPACVGGSTALPAPYRAFPTPR